MREAKEVLRDSKSEMHDLMRTKQHRTPWQLTHILISTIPPTLLFAWVYFCCCSGLRFYHPYLAAALGPVVGVVVCVLFSLQARTRLAEIRPARAWLVLAIVTWASLGLAVLGGEHNYWWHMVSYYDFQDLAAYTNIDPTMDKGQSYMDAGQIYFREFSQVLTDQMVAYRSQNVFCAAPIMLSPLSNQHGEDQVQQDGHFRVPKSGTVDFWAVGMDCCDQETRTFTCGAVGDERARAGIRLLRDDIRPFYHLAVQEWAARLCPLDDNTLTGRSQVSPLICPQARHPLFFHWVVDPLVEVDNFYEKSINMYRTQIAGFAIGNLFLVLALLWAFFACGVR